MPTALADSTLQTVTAKLRAARPHRPLVPRPRLVEATRDRPIVVVVAEAGYGKSSFLVEWSRGAQRRVWYTLDERDRDPTTFGQHLLVAAGADAHAALAWHARGSDDLAGRVLAVLARDDEEVALVLDDYHAVAGAPTVDATLQRLLNDRPPHVRVAISSRTALPVPLERLRAQGLVADIGVEDLCFTRSELEVALIDSELDDHALDALHSMTGGWPAATRLLAEAWARKPQAVRAQGKVTPHAFDAFLEQEVLPRLDPWDVDLLARLSVLDEIDADSSQAVLADASGFLRLTQLSERFSSIAAIEDDEGGQTYRIHRVLRDFLVRRLPAEEWHTSLSRAADFFEARDRPIEAGQAAITLGDTERLASLILKEASRLIAQSRARTLADWFERLPAATIEADARLLARRAHVEGDLGNLNAAQVLFERAAERLLAAGDSVAAADVLRVQAGQLEVAGAFSEARALLTRALDLVVDDNSTLGLTLRNQLSAIRLRDGDPEGALALAREVVERSAALPDAKVQPLVHSVAFANLAGLFQTLGRFDEAERAFHQSIDLKRRAGFHSSLAHTLNNLGVLYQQQGRLAEAQVVLEEALDLAEQYGGAALVHAYALSNLGDVLRDGGDFDVAQAHYTRSLNEKTRLGSDFGVAHTWNCLATLWRMTGDLAQARALNQRALNLRDVSAGPLERLVYQLERGRIALAEGRLLDAHTDLRETAAELARHGARHHALQAGWWAGVALWRAGKKIDPCCREIVEAHAAAPELPGLVPLVAEAPDLGIALCRAGVGGEVLTTALIACSEIVVTEVQRGGVDADVAPLLARLPGNAPLQLLVDAQRGAPSPLRGVIAGVLDAVRRTTAPPISVNGYGGLRVLRRGAPIHERAWRRQRSLELFGLLLLAGPKGRPRDELIVECWPEASPEAGVEQFHTHLHALRSVLEPEAARGTSRYVLSDGRGYRLDFLLVSRFDVLELAALVDRAGEACARGDLAAAEQGYTSASKLYVGPLFAGLTSESEWLFRAREMHEARIVDMRVRLARVREQLGDPAGARAAWTSVLELDPLREDAHRGVMAILHGLGQRDAALAHFRSCADVLRRELGVEPSVETRALYREIAG